MNAISFLTTYKGSYAESYFPKGWDWEKIDQCCSQPPESVKERQPWWHEDFHPVECDSFESFDVKMGHEIAVTIQQYRDEGKQVALIFPVGPMGMYKWAVYFLKEWNVNCGHVHGFNMDEWSDAEGNTVPPSEPGSFQGAMEMAFYGPLDGLTVPQKQRHFATKEDLPKFPEQIHEITSNGGGLVTVFGIGRVCHIAFWEPHFAEEFTEDEWKKQTHRIGAKLHPLTIEQNAITSFNSRTPLVSCYANTIGPGLFLQSHKIIGGADGILLRGMQWQGMSFWITLRHEPTIWLTSTFMPTLPGKLFFHKDLAGPLIADCN